MRKKVIVGNWKMNHTRANALAFVEGMKEEVKVAKELGGSIKITEFVRLEKGEGIEKKQENFADEVAKQIAGK